MQSSRQTLARSGAAPGFDASESHLLRIQPVTVWRCFQGLMQLLRSISSLLGEANWEASARAAEPAGV